MSAPRFPPADLRRELAELRERGVAFEEAWPLACRRIRWPDSKAATAWRQALVATRDEWRAAYERRPSPAGECLAELRVA